ncbi:MAG: cyclic lactone autoinducer peptide [Ruminococcus flavefaciens]|nr:cyclic lactone autoinducer peptide [Ruminococcus flavefaciens]MCM1232392.1 cyclic lactone autoinducer peptide [Ruminococcus flavefaciens]
MQIKKMICKTAAKIVKNAAVNASNSASFGGYNQPKEPEALKKLRKS